VNTHPHNATRARLVSFVNGTLEPSQRDEVREHVATCPACRNEEAQWRALAGAAVRSVSATVTAPPAGPFIEGVLAASEPGVSSGLTARRLVPERRGSGVALEDSLANAGSLPRHVVAVLAAQLHVVRSGIWAASALVFAVGSLLIAEGSVDAGRAFALLAPLIAAAGISVVFGSSSDPRLEVALCTATSPRLVLLARLVLVFAFDLGLAVAASLALVGVHRGGGLWELIGAWLGPMLLLTCLSLVVAVATKRSAAGITVGFALWVVRVLASEKGTPLGGHLAQVLVTLWSTTLPTIALAGCLFGVSVVLLSRPLERS
jgi:hypothetical protein